MNLGKFSKYQGQLLVITINSLFVNIWAQGAFVSSVGSGLGSVWAAMVFISPEGTNTRKR